MQKLTYPLFYQRRVTKTVWVRDLPIGSKHPIVVQSMLTSHTYHPIACLKEIKQLQQAGCMLIRLAIPSRRDLAQMATIRKLMIEEGITIPLAADIHFAPHLALDACEFFEKIRINPGNFSDRAKNSSSRSHLAFDLQEGRERFRQRIIPLVKKLKEKKLALRIGVNQGSLSSRMLQAYGDTPLGMVASALEAIELFAEHNFHQIIVSLKSSNPLVVQKAYRLFCQKSKAKIPLHLGVTEAGNETAGRSKSLVGITPLLFDGIGDTLRISLTENSINEVVFAKQFLAKFSNYEKVCWKEKKYHQNITQYRIENTALQSKEKIQLAGASNVKIGKPQKLQLPEKDFFTADFNYIFTEDQLFFTKEQAPLFVWRDSLQELPPPETYIAILFDFHNPIRSIRKIYQKYQKLPCPAGILLPPKTSSTDYSLEVQQACLLGEGLLDFLLIHPHSTITQLQRLSFLLQATKTKISRTEYIACPSCGRTIFNLQKITAKIKQQTNHLKGIKIGIMGCMVNGPGEMADSDFGYVGSASGKVDLYLGHQRIKRSIPEHLAVDSLIELIKKEGKWVAP